jgi:2,4-dienoyl-CoA reductase-like NADH-dependent reductase (Old Yellow Enzyme family)
MTSLFSPLTIRDVTFANRLWVSPMCQYSVEEKDGVPTDWHLVHLGGMARGGAGLVMAEATAVVPEGRITPWDTGIWNDAQAQAWSRITRFIRERGAVPAIQLAHAGRKASTYRDWSGRGVVAPTDGGWEPVAPSRLPFEGLAEPRELTAAQIADVVAAFGAAARRALDAGFEVLEIHAAHGYLIHEFLSPLSNLRTDSYGGSLENRARLLLEVIREVRDVAGSSVPLFVRLSATDWVEPGGWTLEQTQVVSALAGEAGADLVDVSSGGNVAHAVIATGPGYQVPFAHAVRESTGMLVSSVGQIVDAHQAEEIIASGQADAVMAGREFLRDPHFALRAAHELGVSDEILPLQYRRGTWAARPAFATQA